MSHPGCIHLASLHRHGGRGRCTIPTCDCLLGPGPAAPRVVSEPPRSATVVVDGSSTVVAFRPERPSPRRVVRRPELVARANPVESLEALKAASSRIDGTSIVCWFSVPGEPVPKGRPRFDQRHGRTYTPATTIQAELLVAGYFKDAYPHFEPCADLVGLRLRCYLKGVGRGDWDNYGKLVSDALNGKAWIDDKQVRKADVELIDNSAQPRSDVLVYRIGRPLNPASQIEEQLCLTR